MKRTRSEMPLFETLEPRLFLSASSAPTAALGPCMAGPGAAIVDVDLHEGPRLDDGSPLARLLDKAVDRLRGGQHHGEEDGGPIRSVRFGRDGTASASGAVNPAGDIDIQTFVAPKSGTLSITLSQPGRSGKLAGQLTVYDSRGNSIATAAGRAGGSVTVSVDVLKGDRYYVRVSGQGDTRGAYAVKYCLTPLTPDLAPIAHDDSYSLSEDVPLAVTAGGVLANDADPEGKALSASLVSGTEHGSLTFNPDGTFTYIPAADFSGADSFTYKASDGKNDSNVATVTLTVQAVNDAPVAKDDAYAVDEDQSLVITDLLANDFDVDGDPLQAVLATGPAHGTLAVNLDGSLIYTPDADFNGVDSFTYMASDGLLESNLATVTVTVRPVNDAPVAAPDAYEVQQNTGLSMPVLANDSDVDGDMLRAVVLEGASHGVLEYNPDGSLMYSPADDYTGADSFTYRAFDGQAYSDPVTVTLNVVPVKLAFDDAFTMTAGTTLIVGQPGVLANDVLATGWELACLNSGPQNGRLLSFDPFGGFKYQPNAGFTGTDTFTYMVNDGARYSNIATVTITVLPVA
jgi:VCBS repeat-containing protein